VDVGRFRQALQRQCHDAGLSLSRGGFDLSESEQEGSEKERERVTELHCALRERDKERMKGIPGGGGRDYRVFLYRHWVFPSTRCRLLVVSTYLFVGVGVDTPHELTHHMHFYGI